MKTHKNAPINLHIPLTYSDDKSKLRCPSPVILDEKLEMFEAPVNGNFC